MSPGPGTKPSLSETHPPSRIAVLTMTRDEADMLPRWVTYYGQQVGLKNLFVIDDGTSDGSTDHLPCTVLHMAAGPWKSSWMQMRTDLVNGLSRGLLACFDVVIFTDVDEFLVPDPSLYTGLADYVDRNSNQDVLAATAVNLLHHPRFEPEFDPAKPILAQRRFVKWVPPMCKPLLKRVPAPWMQGFHGIRSPYSIDPDLLLIHLKYYDSTAMATIADRRNDLHVNHGRGAAGSTWALGAEESQKGLLDWVGDIAVDDVPELVPARLDLAGVVHPHPNGFFRSAGRQLVAMSNNPLCVLPDRFRAAV